MAGISTLKRLMRLGLATGGASLLAAGSAFAAPGGGQSFQTYRADLDPLNGSGTHGEALIQVNDQTVTVTVFTDSASPNLPHAQHIHIGNKNICPPPSADDDGNGLISTPEGLPFYGSIEVSLTTRGDVGEASALAIPRFPVASAEGVITYQRTFDLPEGVQPEDLARGVIVQHGISELFADELQYDGEPRSPFAPSLPLEATIPATCGALHPVNENILRSPLFDLSRRNFVERIRDVVRNDLDVTLPPLAQDRFEDHIRVDEQIEVDVDADVDADVDVDVDTEGDELVDVTVEISDQNEHEDETDEEEDEPSGTHDRLGHHRARHNR